MRDREDFEAWIELEGARRMLEKYPSGNYVSQQMNLRWEGYQAARNEPYILRKQAEAVLQCADENRLRALGLIEDYILYGDITHDAREMLKKAAKLEQGENT